MMGVWIELDLLWMVCFSNFRPNDVKRSRSRPHQLWYIKVEV